MQCYCFYFAFIQGYGQKMIGKISELILNNGANHERKGFFWKKKGQNFQQKIESIEIDFDLYRKGEL